jgi:hypothetical protein
MVGFCFSPAESISFLLGTKRLGCCCCCMVGFCLMMPYISRCIQIIKGNIFFMPLQVLPVFYSPSESSLSRICHAKHVKILFSMSLSTMMIRDIDTLFTPLTRGNGEASLQEIAACSLMLCLCLVK